MITTSNLGALMGAPVLGPDDQKIGNVGQIFLDPESGHPNWMTVKTGLFGMKESFVPLDTAEWDHERMHIEYDKDLVKGAPRVDTGSALSQLEEAELYKYYGMSHSDDAERATSGAGSDDPTAASPYARLDTAGGPSSDPGTPGSDYSDTAIGQQSGAGDDGTTGGHRGAHAADTDFDASPGRPTGADAQPATSDMSGRSDKSDSDEQPVIPRRSRMRRYDPADVEAEDEDDPPRPAL